MALQHPQQPQQQPQKRKRGRPRKVNGPLPYNPHGDVVSLTSSTVEEEQQQRKEQKKKTKAAAAAAATTTTTPRKPKNHNLIPSSPPSQRHSHVDLDFDSLPLLPQTPKQKSDPLFAKLSPFNAAGHVDPSLVYREFKEFMHSGTSPMAGSFSPFFLGNSSSTSVTHSPRQSFTDIMKSSPLYTAYNSSPVRGGSPSRTPVLMPLMKSARQLDGLPRKLDFEALAGKKLKRRRVAQKDQRLSPNRLRRINGVTSSPARSNLLLSSAKMNMDFKRGVMGSGSGNDENRTPTGKRKHLDMANMVSSFPITASAKKRRLENGTSFPAPAERKISLSVNEDGQATIDMIGIKQQQQQQPQPQPQPQQQPPRETFGGLLSKNVLADSQPTNKDKLDSRYESSDEDEESLPTRSLVSTPQNKGALVRQRMAQLLSSASSRTQVRSSTMALSSPVSTISSVMDRPHGMPSTPISMYSGMSSSPRRKNQSEQHHRGEKTSGDVDLEDLFPVLSTPTKKLLIAHHNDSEGETDIEDDFDCPVALGKSATTSSMAPLAPSMDAREALRAAISFKSSSSSSSSSSAAQYQKTRSLLATPKSSANPSATLKAPFIPLSPLRFTSSTTTTTSSAAAGHTDTMVLASPARKVFSSPLRSYYTPSTPTLSPFAGNTISIDDMLRGWDSPSTVWGERS